MLQNKNKIKKGGRETAGDGKYLISCEFIFLQTVLSKTYLKVLKASVCETRVNDLTRVDLKKNWILFESFVQNDSTQDLALVTLDSNTMTRDLIQSSTGLLIMKLSA